MVRIKRTFRDKKDFMNWVYRDSDSIQLAKFNREVSRARVPLKMRRGGTITGSYKIALKKKIIKLKKR